MAYSWLYPPPASKAFRVDDLLIYQNAFIDFENYF
jgi:hypothetical protein